MANLLVTGASGPFAQRVLHHLLETIKVPVGQVVAGTRKVQTVQSFAAKGLAVRKVDFEDPLLVDAFTGIDRALVVSTDAYDRPGRRLAQHLAAIKAAERAGVKHVIYTSMPNAERSRAVMAADHLGTEKALADSALPGWTVLRNNWYFETLLVTLAQPLASGRWYSAARDGRIAYVARDDLARAAAFALASSFTGKRTLTLSGARGYSADEVAVAVGETVGRSLSVIHIPLDEFAKVMTASGSPGPVATLLASVESAVAAGDLADVTEDYQALTGLDPTPLRDWLSGNHAAFRQPLETESGAQPNPVPAAMHEGR